MTKYLNNVMAGVAVVSQLLAMIILLFKHGATTGSDQIFISLTFVSIMQLLLVMPFDQFVVFYNRKKHTSLNSAHNFYYSVFFAAIIVSISFVVISIVIVKSNLFFYGKYLNGNTLNGFIVGLIAYPIIALNDRLYNAEGLVSKSYILVVLPQVFLLVGIALWTFGSKFGPECVGYSYAFGIWFGAVYSSFNIIKRFSFSAIIEVKEFVEFLINSVSVRFGQNIYPITMQFVTNWLLSMMGSGYVSVFNYAYKGVAAIFIVAVGPSNRVFMYELSLLASQSRLNHYKIYSKTYLKDSFFIYFVFIILSFIGIFLLSYIKTYYHEIKINIDFFDLGLTFFIVAIWQAIVILESVYVGVIVTVGKSKPFISINVFYVLIYSMLAYAALNIGIIYFFALAGLLAQIGSFYLYKQKVENII